MNGSAQDCWCSLVLSERCEEEVYNVQALWIVVILQSNSASSLEGITATDQQWCALCIA